MKSLAKNLIFLVCVILMAPLILLYRLLALLDRSDQPFASFSQGLSLLPGKTGNYLRGAFYHYCMHRCERHTVISFLTLFSQQGTEIDSGVYIGPGCNIGLCRIGRNTLLGSGVHIMSGKNQHRIDDPDTPIRDQGGRFEKIGIGENCWIGNGALVMAPVGDHCVIGAGSVVVDEIPPGSIAVGNPAKVIQTRPV